jgi:hypothetical protein
MNQMLARAAEAIFIRAGYDREHAFEQGCVVADYLLAHLDECRCQWGADDEFELARLLAQAMLPQSASRRAA